MKLQFNREAVDMDYYFGICEDCGQVYKCIPSTEVITQADGIHKFISCKAIVGRYPNSKFKSCGGFVEMFPQNDDSKPKDTP